MAAYKRGNGEGMIRQRPDGRWEARLTVGIKADGKPDKRSAYGKTRTEVQTKLDALRNKLASGTMPAPQTGRVTFEQFANDWIVARRGSIRESTLERYDDYLRLHIKPMLGRVKLQAIRPEHLMKLYVAKREAGMSPQSVLHVHRLLHTIFTYAVRWDYLAANPAERVDAPKVARVEIMPPSPADMVAVLDTAITTDNGLYALWLTLATTGLRLGEALGLGWDDLDLDQGLLSVRRTLLGVAKMTPRFGEPKSYTSRRTISLAAEVVEALRSHRAGQLEGQISLGPHFARKWNLVFCTKQGAPLGSRNVLRAFKVALFRAGVRESVRIHDLRHFAATHLLAGGIPVRSVAGWLGHSDTRLTTNTYGHATREVDAQAGELLAAVLQRARQA